LVNGKFIPKTMTYSFSNDLGLVNITKWTQLVAGLGTFCSIDCEFVTAQGWVVASVSTNTTPTPIPLKKIAALSRGETISKANLELYHGLRLVDALVSPETGEPIKVIGLDLALDELRAKKFNTGQR
jgi:hypothetical protein